MDADTVVTSDRDACKPGAPVMEVMLLVTT